MLILHASDVLSVLLAGGPGVIAGRLAGYRNEPVYIRNARHVPPGREAVRDLMHAFFDQLRKETDPGVRAVLGRFMFVHIHPYMDGNGRMGRFLMNVMLAGGGYPWTVIPMERRSEYMDALEAASTESDIQPLTAFLTGLVRGNRQSRIVKESCHVLDGRNATPKEVKR